MFSPLFCAELHSSAARSSEPFLAPSAKVLCSFPSTLLTFYFCSKRRFRAAFFPCNCRASPCVSQVEEPSHSHEEILSLSSSYTFSVWQALFSVTAEFLPCTALCLQSTDLFLHRASHLLGTAVWFCIALYIEGSYTMVVIITGVQIYYLVFSNSVGVHVYLVQLSAVFK